MAPSRPFRHPLPGREFPRAPRAGDGDRSGRRPPMASRPARAHSASASPEGPPDTPTAPMIRPPTSTGTPPPGTGTPGMPRTSASTSPARTRSESDSVSVRKLTAVRASRMAASTVCGPAWTSRSSACGTPMRSTTAAATWRPCPRHRATVARTTTAARSGCRPRYSTTPGSAARAGAARARVAVNRRRRAPRRMAMSPTTSATRSEGPAGLPRCGSSTSRCRGPRNMLETPRRPTGGRDGSDG